MGIFVFKSGASCRLKWGELSSKSGVSCLLEWDELSSKSGSSYMWGDLSWGELSLGRVVLIPCLNCYFSYGWGRGGVSFKLLFLSYVLLSCFLLLYFCFKLKCLSALKCYLSASYFFLSEQIYSSSKLPVVDYNYAHMTKMCRRVEK